LLLLTLRWAPAISNTGLFAIARKFGREEGGGKQHSGPEVGKDIFVSDTGNLSTTWRKRKRSNVATKSKSRVPWKGDLLRGGKKFVLVQKPNAKRPLIELGVKIHNTKVSGRKGTYSRNGNVISEKLWGGGPFP